VSTWNAAKAARFFDEYGEREWTRFDDGRTPAPSLAAHVRVLERRVRRGDRALDAGCGPGRFALEPRRVEEPELAGLLAAFDEALGDDLGTRSCGQHIAVLRVA
jgi:ubiquinone/menaquinone biosynthesis C-methylase UbiE